jgi:MFS family permease
VIDGVWKNALGFRGLFALAVVPLAAIFFIRRWLVEPGRFAIAAAAVEHPVPVFGAVGPLYRGRLLTVASIVFAVAMVAGPANSFLFVYAHRVGRRLTGGVALTAVALTGLLTYSGSRTGLFVGFELAVLSASTFAPAAGALVNELFPTAVRASVAGWNVAASVAGAVVGLLAFGAIADVGDRFAFGAAVTFLPAVLATGLFALLPETRGREPEDLWPDVA